MPVDPNIAGLLSLIENSGLPPVAEGTVEQARAGLRTLMVDFRDPAALPKVASVTDTTVAGSTPARIYRPEVEGPVPTVVFFHGGGFVIGDLDTHDGVCRLLSKDVGAVVVSVDYRLAPESRFPVAVEDCYAALTWVAEHIDDYGADASRIAVGGDSAGGNLAAVCAQQAHTDGLALAAQLLVYPAVDMLGDYPSRTENAEGYFLTLADMHWFAENYLGFGTGPGRRGHRRVRPAAGRGRCLRRGTREGRRARRTSAVPRSDPRVLRPGDDQPFGRRSVGLDQRATQGLDRLNPVRSGPTRVPSGVWPGDQQEARRDERLVRQRRAAPGAAGPRMVGTPAAQ
jgi:acetyl esterase